MRLTSVLSRGLQIGTRAMYRHAPGPIVRGTTQLTARMTTGAGTPWAQQRLRYERPFRLTHPLAAGVTVEELELGGRPALRSAGPTTDGVVLYLHGGGYCIGSLRTHLPLSTYLAARTGAAVYQLDYRLAPEHPYPAALHDALAAARELGARHGYENLALAGDSAGGGLAAATALALATEGHRVAALALSSPWCDPFDIPEQESDTVLTLRWLRECLAASRGDAQPGDPGFAPRHGDLSTLPPTIVHAVSTEILYPQSVAFVDAARAAGADVTFADYPELWHHFHVNVTASPKLEVPVGEWADFMRARLAPAPERK